MVQTYFISLGSGLLCASLQCCSMVKWYRHISSHWVRVNYVPPYNVVAWSNGMDIFHLIWVRVSYVPPYNVVALSNGIDIFHLIWLRVSYVPDLTWTATRVIRMSKRWGWLSLAFYFCNTSARQMQAPLSAMYFVQDCEKNLLYELVIKLEPVTYTPGDYICKKVSNGVSTSILVSDVTWLLATSFHLSCDRTGPTM